MNSDEITRQIHSLITIDHLRRSAIVYLRQSTEQQVRDNTGSTDFQRSLANVARSYGWPGCPDRNNLMRTSDDPVRQVNYARGGRSSTARSLLDRWA